MVEGAGEGESEGDSVVEVKYLGWLLGESDQREVNRGRFLVQI